MKMPPALAAESGDMLAQDGAVDQLAEGTIVGLDLPGELVALNYPDGIRLQYFPGDQETGSHPKVVWTDSDGN